MYSSISPFGGSIPTGFNPPYQPGTLIVRQMKIKKNILLSVVMLFALIYASYLYLTRVQTIDPKLQKEIEANIPECAERDKVGEALRKRMKEENRSYCYGYELDDYDRKAKEMLQQIREGLFILGRLGFRMNPSIIFDVRECAANVLGFVSSSSQPTRNLH